MLSKLAVCALLCAGFVCASTTDALPRTPEARLDRAASAIAAGAYLDALSILAVQPLVATDEFRTRETLLKAEALLGSGSYEAAKAQARAAVALVEIVFRKGPQLADALLLLGRTEMQVGQRGGGEASTALERALSSAVEVDGAQSLRALRVLDRIALLMSAAGQSRAAEGMIRDVLDKSAAIKPEPVGDRLRFTNTLGIVLLRQSKFEGARAAFALARDGRAGLLSHRHPETLESAHNLAVALRLQQQYEAASELLARVIDTRKAVLGADHPDTLTSRTIMVRQLKDRGDVAAAERESREVVWTLTKKVGANDRRTIEAESDLGQILFSSGKRGEGLKLYQATFQRAVAHLGDSHPETMSLGHELGSMLVEAGKLPEALAVLNGVLEPTRKMLGDTNRATLATLNSIGRIQHDLGRLEEAERIYRYILLTMDQSVGRDDLDRASVLNNLASALLATGQSDEALKAFEEVAQVRTNKLGPERRLTLLARSNQAAALSKLGRYQDALAIHHDVLRIRERTLSAIHPETLRSRHNIASTLDESGAAENARTAFEDVLKLRTDVLGLTHRETLLSLRGLAGVLYSQGDREGARQRYRELKAAAEILRTQGRLSDDLQRSLFANLAPAYRMLALVEAELGNFAEAFEAAEFARARTVLEMTATRATARASVLTEDEQFQLQAIEAESARLDNQIANLVGEPVRRAELDARRNELIEKFQHLHGAMQAKYPKYAAATEVRIALVADIAKILPANTAFLQFVSLGPRLLILWATGEGEKGILRLSDTPGLVETIDAYRAALARPNGVEDLRYPPLGEPRYFVWKLKDGSFRLRQTSLGAVADAVVVQDIAEIREYLSQILVASLPGAVTRLPNWIISPDGPLALLPFDTLQLQGEMLVMRREITSIQSLSMLRLLIDRGGEYAVLARETLLAIGDPIYTPANLTTESSATAPTIKAERELQDALQAARPSAFKRWPQLPGAALELNVLTQMFGLRDGHSRFAGAAASEETVRKLEESGALAKFRYVVFSAHGDLDMSEPRLSAVVLSQTNLDALNDGYLRAAELQSFSFRSDLVVVSACDSAVGTWLMGEGILGLPFSLYVAGNRSTLLTLWPIYDASTAEFMRRFFGRLSSGTPLGQALALTKREFATGDAGDSVRSPAYWAAFSLFGVPF